MNVVAENIGRKVKFARNVKGLTQIAVASQMHMTQQQYSRFELGVYELNYQQIIFLCKLLEISASSLFDV